MGDGREQELQNHTHIETRSAGGPALGKEKHRQKKDIRSNKIVQEEDGRVPDEKKGGPREIGKEECFR
jgi:hypothetical protein